jgi:hypothetical protein
MGIFSPRKKEKTTNYYFLYLKDIYGLKDIGSEASEEEYFKNNSETFKQYVIRKYGKKVFASLPIGIVIKRETDLSPFMEINSNIVFGELNDLGAGLLLCHREYYEYGTEERFFGVEKDGYWSIDKGYLAGSYSTNRLITDNIEEFIKNNLSMYSKESILQLTKYLLDFSKQTIISKNKYYENLLKEKSILGAQLTR